MRYWDNEKLPTKILLQKLVDNNIIRTTRFIPGGVDFLYAGRIVTLNYGEARWFALAHLYHLEKEAHDI